jgi:hypothetical protein
VPENSGLVFHNSHICCYHCLVTLNKEATGISPRRVPQLSQLDKSSKAPIALILGKPVMRRMNCIYLWVVRIPEDNTKLRAANIIIRGFVGVSLFEIERSVVDVITVRKHENTPSPVSPYVRRRTSSYYAQKAYQG